MDDRGLILVSAAGILVDSLARADRARGREVRSGVRHELGMLGSQWRRRASSSASFTGIAVGGALLVWATTAMVREQAASRRR